ncbi:MAG: DNA methyltransferase, partial [Planctomycetes bacterium]|nr:DNA methyltransferase [Planctomycetota bacterium]
LDDTGKERVGVFLTNALTGWEPPKEPKSQLPFLEMEVEREGANKIKRDKPILVVLGNPPYNAFAGTSPAEEAGLVDAYKEGLNTEWGVRKFNLDDLYVRFFRVAERRIVKSGWGVVSFISNYSWSAEPSFVVLRKRLSDNFDKIWIENLHGNRKISEYAPDGRTSETVFAIPGFSPGIRQGVVTSLWVRTGNERKKSATIYYRDDLHDARAVERRRSLLASLKNKHFDRQYEKVIPVKADRYSFRPGKVSKQYRQWPSLTDLCAVPPMNGLMEKRGGALIDIDRVALEKRMRAYFDRKLDWDAYVRRGYGLTKKQAGFVPSVARKKALESDVFTPKNIVRYCVRPYDDRWCYYTAAPSVWNRPRPALWAQCWEGNSFFVSRLRTLSAYEGWPCFFVTGLSDDHLLMPDASCFPIRLKNGTRLRKRDEGLLFAALGDKPEEDEPAANLSTQARDYLAGLGIRNPDADEKTAGLLWYHALAICCSPAYLVENAAAVRADWPRIPLPATARALRASAELGRTIAALLDAETPVPGVTTGKIRPGLRLIGVLFKEGGVQIDPNAGDLDLTAGWGHAGKDDVTMPGRGCVVERPMTPAERKAQGAAPSANQSTLDVFINGKVCWKNIPETAWNFTIGGYQVLKKWLSYREHSLIERALTLDEAEYVTSTARRLAVLAEMSLELDKNYQAIR